MVGFVKILESNAIPSQAFTGAWGSRSLRLPEFLDSRKMKASILSAWRTDRLSPQDYHWNSFLLEADSAPVPEGCRNKQVNKK
jgi:hypothetical protein